MFWSNAGGFRAAKLELVEAVEALSRSVTSGSPEEVRARIADVGVTCKGCHAAFRTSPAK